MKNQSLYKLIAITFVLALMPLTGLVVGEEPGVETEHLVLKVEGMQSDACEFLLQGVVISVSDHIHEVKADHETGEVKVLVESGRVEIEQIVQAIEDECSFRVLERPDEQSSSPGLGEPAV